VRPTSGEEVHVRSNAVVATVLVCLVTGASLGANGAEPDTTAAGASHRLWGELIVRVPLSAAELREMTSQIARIWEPLGIAVVWTHLRPAAVVPPGYSGWVRVLIEANATDYVVPRNDAAPALAALHMPGGVPRNVIYVSLDAARALVRRATSGTLTGPDRNRLVARTAGRAIAHELGHYLLGTPDHADDGLMRRTFTVADVLDSDVARFRLAPSDALRVAERLSLDPSHVLASSNAGGAK
jgi:hypothetical protein